MKTEPRIVLYENWENKGAFYIKVKGILISKGKYIMILDEDDIYVQRDTLDVYMRKLKKIILILYYFKLDIQKQ